MDSGKWKIILLHMGSISKMTDFPRRGNLYGCPYTNETPNKTRRKERATVKRDIAENRKWVVKIGK